MLIWNLNSSASLTSATGVTAHQYLFTHQDGEGNSMECLKEPARCSGLIINHNILFFSFSGWIYLLPKECFEVSRIYRNRPNLNEEQTVGANPWPQEDVLFSRYYALGWLCNHFHVYRPFGGAHVTDQTKSGLFRGMQSCEVCCSVAKMDAMHLKWNCAAAVPTRSYRLQGR